ncbi:phosphotransferase [Nonomuraea sp. K274]|uniref:Phosphotransferase n=1 Tax=Nonomuraea cypriaca TaxID=1187855 RepID=A0A931ALZ0_9ACTN|nr:phosphotransferase [Nonomuraea cypriaca]MBF8191402.1 phosphotransferase [Nonomuraea cypriaca]
MRLEEVQGLATVLGGRVTATRTLAGGFSHETCLLTLTDGQVVARLGGPDPRIEAAVMAAARRHVPVPRVLHVLPAGSADGVTRPAMVLEHVQGTPLSDVLSRGRFGAADLRDLGAEVGRVVAAVGTATFGRPGFFADEHLAVHPQAPWSKQLAEFAVSCMAAASAQERLDPATRAAWADLCAAHAPALAVVDGHSRLVHADTNPKNILVTRTGRGWRVDALLDWEFGYAGCPYGDAANMARFGADYPAGFLAGFLTAFAEHQPTGLPLAEDWAYLGRVLDMFALSDLVTRTGAHPIADQAAEQIRRWVAEGVPRHIPG